MINIKNPLNKKTTKVFLTICTGFVVSSMAMPAQANTRGRLESIRKTQYAIECRNLKRKHAKLEEIYRNRGEAALRKAIQSPEHWISSSELNYWKGCQANWWYQYL